MYVHSSSAKFTNLNGCYFYFLGARAGGVAEVGGRVPRLPPYFTYMFDIALPFTDVFQYLQFQIASLYAHMVLDLYLLHQSVAQSFKVKVTKACR